MKTARIDAWTVSAVALAVLIGAFAMAPTADRTGDVAPGAATPPAPAPGSPAVAPASPAAANPTAPSPPTAPPSAAPAGPAPPPLGTLLLADIHDQLGAMLPDASVNLYRGDATKPIASASLRLTTQFVWPGLQPDSYRLTVRSGGMRSLEHRFELPPGLADLHLDLALEPSWLLKVVLQTADGRPWHETQAELQKARPNLDWYPEPIAIIATWQDIPAVLPSSDLRQTPFSIARWSSAREPFRRGSEQLPARYAGVLDIPETRRTVVAAVIGSAVLQQVPVEPGQEEVTLTLDGNQLLAQFGRVLLQVVDATTRAPLPQAKVGLDDAQSFKQPAPVDAEGRIELRDLRPGLMELSVTAEGRTGPSVSVDIAPGATIDLGHIALVEPFPLKLRLQNRTGEKDLNVSLLPLDPPGHAALRPAAIRVGGKGDEMQAKIAPGRYRLRITGGGGALLEFDTNRLGTEPLVVALQPEVPLRLDSTALADPVQLVLRAPNGAVVFDRWITWRSAWEQPLLPGTYGVEVRSFAGPTRREDLVVPVDGASYVLR